MHTMELLGNMGHVEDRFGPFRDNANLAKDWCTVYAKRISGSEIILDAPDGTPR
jgi:hypothetical protein